MQPTVGIVIKSQYEFRSKKSKAIQVLFTPGEITNFGKGIHIPHSEQLKIDAAVQYEIARQPPLQDMTGYKPFFIQESNHAYLPHHSLS